MRRPRHLVLAAAILFASSSLVLVFATNVHEEAAATAPSWRTPVTLESLAGQDRDGNGIRDDVDAFIAQRYGKDASMREAAEQIARSIQPALALDLSTVSSTAAVAENEVQVMSCVILELGSARRGDVEDMINRVADKTYDNSARFQKREAFRQLASDADFSEPAQCAGAQPPRMLSAQL